MKRNTASLALTAVALLLLAACGSMNDVLGTGPSDGNSASAIRGTVDSVDLNSRSILLTNASGYNSMLSGGNNGSVRVYFDDRTTVEYQGKAYRPENLERGDQVDVRVSESGNRLIAEEVTVTYDAGSGTGSSYPNGGGYTSVISGTIRSVDTSRRTIEVDRGNGIYVVLDYDTRTTVSYNGTSYNPADLDRGDQVDIRVTDTGSGRMLAQRVDVVRSAGGTGGSGTYRGATVRGTVRSIDTVARTIELEQTSWISGFTGGSTSGSRIVIRYDTSARVEVSGQLYAVTSLERGDVVDVEVSDRSNPFAQRITLVRDVRR
jgi:hypothetical protein